jgi:hypothetical protein
MCIQGLGHFSPHHSLKLYTKLNAELPTLFTVIPHVRVITVLKIYNSVLNLKDNKK